MQLFQSCCKGSTVSPVTRCTNSISRLCLSLLLGGEGYLDFGFILKYLSRRLHVSCFYVSPGRPEGRWRWRGLAACYVRCFLSSVPVQFPVHGAARHNRWGCGGDATPCEDTRQERGPRFKYVAGVSFNGCSPCVAGRRVPLAYCGRLSGLTRDMLTRCKVVLVKTNGKQTHKRESRRGAASERTPLSSATPPWERLPGRTPRVLLCSCEVHIDRGPGVFVAEVFSACRPNF